jgi:hypothetical protein
VVADSQRLYVVGYRRVYAFVPSAGRGFGRRTGELNGF